MQSRILSDTRPNRVSRQKQARIILLWGILVLFFVLLEIITGGFIGYRAGRREIISRQILADVQYLQEQYLLGLQDYEGKNFELARQRFEYILSREPDFPGVSDKLVEILQILYATATPTPLPPTVTPTPTQDLRPVEEIYSLAQNYYDSGDWNNLIETIINLRRENPSYRVVEVDGMLFRALRNRGVQKIQAENNLEGGIYDLALTERFGPLDAEANNWRNLARLYMIGSAFWEVFPEQAVYYFSQVASAAPYLRDASG